jgi:two-component system, chemotaxis family, CheB/CheR fusion protein
MNKKNSEALLEKNPIVAIGASAGGLEAFSALLKELPDNTGLSFVFIQHLDASHKSALSDILSRCTSMKVQEAVNNMKLKPNEVYVIPPNKYIELKNNTLILTERKAEGIFSPIDFFFNSLARELKHKAIGVVLSGTASDGVKGLETIKAEGGITFAQDEESAKFNGMPGNAAASGYTDMIFPPGRIAAEIARISKHPFLEPENGKEKHNKDSSSLNSIFRILRERKGVDFSDYKQTTISRRIKRRILINKLNSIDDYAGYIKNNKDEAEALYKDLLINVTEFFREPLVFDVLKKTIFPSIIKNKKKGENIRIWVPGCSTGEEVYSIAISLLEFLGEDNKPGIQIFATDISESALEKGRAGVYPEVSLVNMDQEYLNYFIKNSNGYQVKKQLRDLVIFARQNISSDPPFSNIDLISCRNLLIYFSPELQKKVIPVFHYALSPDGFLLLGGSESIGKYADLFSISDKKIKIYRKKHSSKKIDINFNVNLKKSEYQKKDLKSFLKMDPDNDIIKEVDNILLNQFAPAGFLVNDNLDVIQFRGDAGKYLSPAPGSASLNLYKLTNEGLLLSLSSAISKAGKSGATISLQRLKYKIDGKSEEIDIDIIPVKKTTEQKENFYLILFKEKKSKVEEDINNYGHIIDAANMDELEQIKKELLISHEHLKSVIEEREIMYDEFRSAVEELQASNEELQSTNEELETAKEELQSTNEELITVNEELENKNNELSEVNNDLVNFLASVNIAIIMLDSKLKVRRFTPKAEKLWNLIPGDIGRPLSDINPKVKIPGLKDLIHEVIETLETKEFDTQDEDNNWYSVRLRPYKTIENKIEGVVISLLDVDLLKKGFISAVRKKEIAEAVFDTMMDPSLVLNTKLFIQAVNTPFSEFFKLEEDPVNRHLFEITNGVWDNMQLSEEIFSMLSSRKEFNAFKFEADFPTIGRKVLYISGKIIELRENAYICLTVDDTVQ